MEFAFKVIEGDLAYHRVDHILDLAGQQDLALCVRSGVIQHFLEGQHFAKDAGCFRQGQRCGGEQFALTSGQHLMNAVPKLMGQCHDIARFPQIVEHHVGVHIGDCRMSKGPWCLAGLDACIDPAFGEKRLGQVAHARVKGGVRIHDHALRRRPVDRAGVFDWQGRVAIPNLHLVEAQPLAF